MRRFSLRTLAAFSALAIGAAGCGGGSSTPVTTAPNPTFSTGSIPSQLLIKDWGESTVRSSRYIGPVSNVFLTANVLVHQQNAQALLQYAADTSNPASGNFRRWLKPQDLAARFGASQADYQAAAAYFAQAGLVVGAWPQRMMLSVSGSQSSMERAFNTTFGAYAHNGQTFVAPVSMPHFSSAIPVDAVGHLVAYSSMRRDIMTAPRAGSGVNIGYSPQLIRGAFDFNGAYRAGFNGSGITVAIIGTGPIDSYSGGSGDHDLDAFSALYNGLNVAHVTQVNVTGSGVAAGLGKSGIPTPAPGGTAPPNGFPYANAFQTPPPVTSSSCKGQLPKCNPEDLEAQLDVQQAASIAPGASVDFYLAYNAADCTTVTFPNQCAGTTGSPAIGINESDPEIQQVIADNVADIISMSYGGGEPDDFPNSASYANSYFQLEFAELAAEGIASFASSGDNGSAGCLMGGGGYQPEVCVGYPAGDTNVTSVGGVSAYISALGALQAPLLGWGISTQATGYGGASGSGGGTSTIIAAPPWQMSILHNTMREQPDVSLIGDPNTGVTLLSDARFGGGPSNIGGTSVASPEMAATWALVLSACKQHPGAGLCPASTYRLGNAAPYLYAILGGTAIGGITPSLPYGSVFFDVLYGSNEMEQSAGTPSVPIPGANAMPGYDEVTGVGVPFAGHLIQAMTGVAVP